MSDRNTIRIGIPSKGRLRDSALSFLEQCGLSVYKPNSRQYIATMPALPNVQVVFQRAGDIVVGVRSGSLDFGITGLDIAEEYRGEKQKVVVMHPALGFGSCRLELAVPETWTDVDTVADLGAHLKSISEPRLASKFPVLTQRFLAENNLDACKLIAPEGTLEIAPELGYADFIVDLVSSGQTLKDNRMKTISGGCILNSQACLIGSRENLKDEAVLAVANTLLELTEANLRAKGFYHLIGNIRGDSPETIGQLLFEKTDVGGLTGPTVARVVDRQNSNNTYAIEVIVPKPKIATAVKQLRAIGTTGVVVMPITYIFEEAPASFTELQAELANPTQR